MNKQQPKPKKIMKMVEPKVKLYPQGEASAKSVDSLKRVGYGKAIGNPIIKKGMAPMYGAASSDVIKKALQPKKSTAKPMIAKKK